MPETEPATTGFALVSRAFYTIGPARERGVPGILPSPRRRDNSQEIRRFEARSADQRAFNVDKR
jgi:hypothetical protein